MVNFIPGASIFLNILLIGFIFFAIHLRNKVDDNLQEQNMYILNKIFKHKEAQA